MDKIVSKHFLVPVHEIVPKDKEEDLLKRLGCDKKQLPLVLASDAAIVEVGGEKGDVIRITRDSLTAKKSTYFRVVV